VLGESSLFSSSQWLLQSHHSAGQLGHVVAVVAAVVAVRRGGRVVVVVAPALVLFSAGN